MSQTLLHRRTSNKTKAVANGKAALKTAKKLVRQHKKLQRQKLNNNTAQVVAAAQQVVAKVAGVLGLYVAFDFEWDNETHVLLAASFVDSNGKKQVFFNTGSELELIKKIISVLLNYKVSMGWNSSTSIESNSNYTFIAPTTAEDVNFEEAAETNGYSINLDTKCDVGILDERIKVYGLQHLNLIRKFTFGSKVYYSFNGFTHIDLYQVYGKILVQDVIYESKYRTLKLNDVAVALLGTGKYKHFSGKDFSKLSVKDKKAYVLRDSELVIELSKYKNYQILDVMNEIALITGLPFERVCRTNLTAWWGEIFDKMVVDGAAPRPIRLTDIIYKKYRGALVLEPVKGYYDGGAILVDAASLYPTMAIVYNLSYETVNCLCCKDNPKARVKFADDKFYDACQYLNKNSFWICRNVKQGAFAKKLEIFRKEKARYSQLVTEAKTRKDEAAELEYKAKLLATKILLNGGYGCFGSQQYRYYNPLVAEAITTFGRYTLSKMQVIAKGFGFEIKYGDTDSLLLVGKNKSKISKDVLESFMKKCTGKLQVELEMKTAYDKLILSAGKKHYLGIGVDKKGNEVFDIVGFEGKKSDRCEFIQQVFNGMVTIILRKGTDPIPNIRKAIADLKARKVKPELLKTAIRLNQNPEDYKSQTCRPAKIGKELGLRKGELAEFYYADIKKTKGKSWTRNPKEIGIQKYMQALWNTLEEVLELVGYSKADLIQEFGVKLAPKKNKNKKQKSGSREVSLLPYKHN